MIQRILTYYVRGSIIGAATSCLTDLDSSKQLNMLVIITYQSSWIHTNESGDQLHQWYFPLHSKWAFFVSFHDWPPAWIQYLAFLHSNNNLFSLSDTSLYVECTLHSWRHWTVNDWRDWQAVKILGKKFNLVAEVNIKAFARLKTPYDLLKVKAKVLFSQRLFKLLEESDKLQKIALRAANQND